MGAVLGVAIGVLFGVLVSRPLGSQGFVLALPYATLVVLLRPRRAGRRPRRDRAGPAGQPHRRPGGAHARIDAAAIVVSIRTSDSL